ncbi:hypothetical protein KIPB_016476, partial [Kipferlia bialata]
CTIDIAMQMQSCSNLCSLMYPRMILVLEITETPTDKHRLDFSDPLTDVSWSPFTRGIIAVSYAGSSVVEVFDVTTGAAEYSVMVPEGSTVNSCRQSEF